MTTIGRSTVAALVVFCVLPNSAPLAATPTATGGNQYRADTGATIAFGGTVAQGVGVYFEANVGDADGNSIKMEVELRKLPATFAGVANYSSSFRTPGSRARSGTATNLASGNYGWRYRVVDTTGAASNWVAAGNPDFVVAAVARPSAPTLSSPGNGQTGVSTTPSFDWTSVSNGGATGSYRIQVATNAAHLSSDPDSSSCASSCVVNATVGTSSYSLASALAPGTTYHWQVHALGSSLGGTWSTRFSFTTAAAATRPSAPTLTLPAHGQTGVSTTPAFDWSSVSNGGATGSYRIQVATNAAHLSSDPDSSSCGSNCVLNTTVGTSSYSLASALAPGTTYHWQVHALGSSLGGTWSTRFSFTTAAAATRPPAPSLNSPTHGQANVPATPGFGWTAVSNGGATGSYRIQVATDAAHLSSDPDSSSCAASCAINTTVSGTGYSPPSALAPGTTYHWQVHALGSSFGGVWSTRSSFTTAAAATRPSAPSLGSPGNGESGVSATPNFNWTSVSNGGATGSYRIQVATNAAHLSSDPDGNACGSSCAVNRTVGSNNHSQTSPLAAGTTYHWQVHALGTSLGGVWSTRSSFVTATAGGRPPSPSLNSPRNGETGISTPPLFDWTTVTGGGATGSYRIQVASNPADLSSDPESPSCGPSCLINEVVGSSSFPNSRVFAGSTTYYWQVQALGGPGGTWSRRFSFATVPFPWGAAVGAFRGVTAYSNGEDLYDSGQYHGTGLKWQCVEYINRYYARVYGMDIRKDGGDAYQYYDSATSRGLVAYENDGTTPPQEGDVLAFGCPEEECAGHVAIIREVGPNYVRVAQQNVTQNARDADFEYPLTFSNGKYKVSPTPLGSAHEYFTQGWLRRPAAPVGGLCGSANGGSFTAAPAAELCSAGAASAVTGAGPWQWSCAGSDGGSNASCSANLVTARIMQVSGNLDFGNVQIGATANATLAIANSGNSAMTVTGIAYPPGFSGAWTGDIPAGRSQPVTVTFSPNAATPHGGTIFVDANHGSGTDTAGVAGTGTALAVPNCTLSASPGTIAAGGTSTLTVTCAPEALSYVWANTGFSSDESSGTVSPASTLTYSVVGNGNDGTGNTASVTVTVLPPNPVRLSGISTRSQVLTGDDVTIGGFIVEGSAAKKVVVRGRGPSLGIAGVLADPTLTVVPASGPIMTNDDWGSADNAAELSASGFAPGTPKESAILAMLNPGAYTAILKGVGDTTGVGIIEVYELEQPGVPLVGISTRARVQTGDNVMIGGFIIQGDSPQTVVVRARGPSLGIAGNLADPTLTIVPASGPLLENDDWVSAGNAVDLSASGFAPAHPKESALLVTLNPGAYTVIVKGVADTTGIAIVEVYSLD